MDRAHPKRITKRLLPQRHWESLPIHETNTRKAPS
jgi:hypothetical protein